jgi:hypothetical protein
MHLQPSLLSIFIALRQRFGPRKVDEIPLERLNSLTPFLESLNSGRMTPEDFAKVAKFHPPKGFTCDDL